MKYFALFLLFLFSFPKNGFSQDGIPDSVIVAMEQIDSLESILETLDSTLNNIGIINPLGFINGENANPKNFKRCRKNYEISYAQDINLCGDGKMIEVFNDQFDLFDPFFWKKIDNCADGCAMNPVDPESDCEGETGELNDKMETMRQWFTSENVRNENGLIIIDTKYEPEKLENKSWFNTSTNTTTSRDFLYSSGYLMSQFMFPFDYGKIEARIKLPYNRQGIQPAFWMYNGETEKNPAVNGYSEWNELDIFEFRDDESLMKTTIFKKNGGNSCQSYYRKTRTYFDEWHIYTCYWYPYGIAIFIDNDLVFVRSQYLNLAKSHRFKIIKDEVVKKKEIYPDKPMDLRFNNYVYVCDDHKPFPYEFPRVMEIDWVKVSYQRKCDADILVDNIDELPHDTRLYNFIVGANVLINVDYEIPEKQMLKIIHSSELKIDQLEVNGDGLFISEPKPDLCDGPSLPNDISNSGGSNHNDHIPSESSKLRIYPNPVVGVVNINNYICDINDIIYFTLYDLNGRKVYNINLENIRQNSLKLDSLENGFYLYTLRSEKTGLIETGKLLLCIEN